MRTLEKAIEYVPRNQRGRVVTNWPWRVVDYWRRTLEPDMAEFHTRPNNP